MTDDRSLERAARSWIEVGPTAAPPHVVDAALDLIAHTPQERDWLPWRFPRMPISARVVALVAIGAVMLASAFALLGPGRPSTALPSPVPSTTPSPSAGSSPSGPELSETFSSLFYGYTVKYPGGWKAHPATRVWSAGAINTWDSGFNDELFLTGGDLRFSGASQALATGQSADQWLTAYAAGVNRAGWRTVTIDGVTGYVTSDGVAAAGGTIAPGGRMFDAVVVSGDRAYNFNMDGNVDQATFDAFLATITLDPASAHAVPALTASFTSDRHGYSMKLPASWTVRPASKPWPVGADAPGPPDPRLDQFTDPADPARSFVVVSQPLKSGTTTAAWLTGYEASAPQMPQACWPVPSDMERTTVSGSEAWVHGGTTSCGFTEAITFAGGRVYELTGYAPPGSAPFDRRVFDALLATVVLDPTKANDR